jgi:hypothetical protein
VIDDDVERSAVLVILKPLMYDGHFVGSSKQLISLVQERQGHHGHAQFTNRNPHFEDIHIYKWFPRSVSEPMLHVPDDLDLNAVHLKRPKMRAYDSGACERDWAFLVCSEDGFEGIGIMRSCAQIDILHVNWKTL